MCMRACASEPTCVKPSAGFGPGSHAFAAGITWTSRTLQAEWAGRQGHTSVIDAAGAIYVIGGAGNGTYYKDVWINGGTDRTESRGYIGY
jgi:hypothetical protein